MENLRAGRGQVRVGEREVRVERDRLGVKLDGPFVILEQRVGSLLVGQGAQIKHVGVRVLGRLLFDADFFFRRKGGAQAPGRSPWPARHRCPPHRQSCGRSAPPRFGGRCLASTNCTLTAIRSARRRTLPSRIFATPNDLPISRMFRLSVWRYFITLVRLITFRSLILARFVSRSS